MKAIVLRQPAADPAQAFVLADLAEPQPGPKEITIRLHAASVNPLDALMRQGYGEALFRWLRPKGPVVLGLDGAGTVQAVGSRVQGFRPGDRVMAAVMPFRSGFYAQSVAVPAAWCAAVPPGMPMDVAAALPYAGLTGLQVLRAARLDAESARGRKVLVHGGSGGIGSMLVQILHHWGAWVASTCRTDNLAFVKDLGADQVVDYRRQDFTQLLKDLDVVVNTVAPKEPKLDEAPHLSVLRRGGRFVSLISPTLELAGRLGAPLGLAASGLWMAGAAARWGLAGKHHAWVYFRPSGADLEQLGRWVGEGVFRPVIGARLPLQQAAAAHRAVEAGPARGKMLLMMDA